MAQRAVTRGDVERVLHGKRLPSLEQTAERYQREAGFVFGLRGLIRESLNRGTPLRELQEKARTRLVQYYRARGSGMEAAEPLVEGAQHFRQAAGVYRIYSVLESIGTSHEKQKTLITSLVQGKAVWTDFGIGQGLLQGKTLAPSHECTVIGLDFSHEMVEQAEAFLREHGFKVRIITSLDEVQQKAINLLAGNYNAAPLPSGITVSNTSFACHHNTWEQNVTLFGRVYEATRQGGVFVLGEVPSDVHRATRSDGVVPDYRELEGIPATSGADAVISAISFGSLRLLMEAMNAAFDSSKVSDPKQMAKYLLNLVKQICEEAYGKTEHRFTIPQAVHLALEAGFQEIEIHLTGSAAFVMKAIKRE